MNSSIINACLFATIRHGNQQRKGRSCSPFIIHPLRVSRTLLDITNDPVLASAAILHDTIEDTGTTYEQLLAQFGKEIADLVAEVTDDITLPKRQSKEILLAKMPTLSYEAQLLKIADQIDNVGEVGYDPPVSWSFDTRRGYVGWCNKLVYAAKAASTTTEGQALIKLFNRTYTSTMLLIGAQEEISGSTPPRQ